MWKENIFFEKIKNKNVTVFETRFQNVIIINLWKKNRLRYVNLQLLFFIAIIPFIGWKQVQVPCNNWTIFNYSYSTRFLKNEKFPAKQRVIQSSDFNNEKRVRDV